MKASNLLARFPTDGHFLVADGHLAYAQRTGIKTGIPPGDVFVGVRLTSRPVK